MTTPLELWQDDSPTPYGRSVYTDGDCWVLAWTLSQQLDEARIFALGDPASWLWEHVVVEVDDDLYLDIDGLSTREDLHGRWNGEALMEVEETSSFKAYQWYLGMDEGKAFPHTVGEADAVAAKLIALYL